MNDEQFASEISRMRRELILMIAGAIFLLMLLSSAIVLNLKGVDKDGWLFFVWTGGSVAWAWAYAPRE